jgi:hypothetical protein
MAYIAMRSDAGSSVQDFKVRPLLSDPRSLIPDISSLHAPLLI